MMFNINLKENKIFLVPVVILFLILLASLTVLRPKISDIFKARRELNSNRRQLTILTEKLSTLEGLAGVELNEKVDDVLRVLPIEKDVAKNLFVLKRLALDSGLVFSGMNLSEVGEISTGAAKPKLVGGAILPSLAFDVLVIGTQDKIKNFLVNLKSVSPLMKVVQLSTTQRKENVPESTVLIESFYLPLPKTIGKLVVPITPISREEENVLVKISEFKIFKDEEEFYFATGIKGNPFSF